MFSVGDQIDAYTSLTAGSQSISGATITAVNVATNTLTLSASVTWSTGDYVFFAGCRGKEAYGLPEAVDNGTGGTDVYFGNARTTNPTLQSVVDTTAAAPSAALFNDLINTSANECTQTCSVQ